MTTICLQMGHVGRTTGATGTRREQEMARAVGTSLSARLKGLGHTVHLVGADDPVPATKVFIALHGDGSTNPARHGASVGYPPGSEPSARLARAWKAAYQQCGYNWGFLADNYTVNLSSYYGFRKSSAEFEFLAEHGTLTNKEEENWIFGHIDNLVNAHVLAIGAVIGHPAPQPLPVPVVGGRFPNIVDFFTAPGRRGWLVGADGGIFAKDDGAFYGGMAGKRLNAPLVAGLATPTGKGYWLFGADGGVFAFGDAPFRGTYGALGSEYAQGIRAIVGGYFRGDPAKPATWSYGLVSDRLELYDP